MICADNECGQEATQKIWCPTWVRSGLGPMTFCDVHARFFDSSLNPYAHSGQFFFGDEADKAYKSVEAFFDRADDRYFNAYGMLLNGQLVSGSALPNDPDKLSFLQRHSLYVVDGKVWLATFSGISRLGDWPDVKDLFPKLFT